MEEGTDTSEMEYLMNQISRQHQYIRNLELALVRIENKTYGICRVSGRLIPKERLRVVPHATMSLESKMSRKSDETSPGAAVAGTPPTDFAEGFED
jgi:RNA polymerase-binding transcription factor DksA